MLSLSISLLLILGGYTVYFVLGSAWQRYGPDTRKGRRVLWYYVALQTILALVIVINHLDL